MDQASQSVDREVKFKDRRFDKISREYHLKELKELLSNDPVLKPIKPKLAGSLRGPITAVKSTLNVLEALRRRVTCELRRTHCWNVQCANATRVEPLSRDCCRTGAVSDVESAHRRTRPRIQPYTADRHHGSTDHVASYA